MIAIAFVSFHIPAAHAQSAPPAFPVTVAPPLLKHIKTWDEYPGRFEALARVELRPRVSGYVDQVNFKEGSTVKQGDLLFTLDKRPFEIAVEAAKAEVARAKAQVDFAQADLERAAPLVESKALSEQVFEQRKSSLGVAQAQVMSAKAQLGRPNSISNGPKCARRFPAAVSDKKIDVGNLVIGGQVNSTLMATIVTTDPIHFVFDTSEADYMRYARLNSRARAPRHAPPPIPVRVKLADENDLGPRRRHGLRRQRVQPTLRHDPRPRPSEQQGRSADARHLRPDRALRRRLRRPPRSPTRPSSPIRRARSSTPSTPTTSSPRHR